MPNVHRMTLEAKLYYGTAGSTAATEITNIVGDLTQTQSKDKAEITRRGKRIKSYKGGHIDVTIGWTMNWIDGDGTLEALQAAFSADTVLAFRTKDYSSGKGWDADFIVTKFDKKEGDGKQQTVDVEIAPNDELRDPNSYV